MLLVYISFTVLKDYYDFFFKIPKNYILKQHDIMFIVNIKFLQQGISNNVLYKFNVKHLVEVTS